MALRLTIDGDWSAADFAALFEEVDRLYAFAAARFRIFAYAPIDDDRFLFRLTEATQPIRVRRIQYASPGFTDLVGLGALTRELRELLQFLIIHFREREDRKLSRQEKRLQIARARLELLEKFAELRRSGLTDHPLSLSASVEQYLELPKFDRLAEAIIEDRLTGAEEVPDDIQ